MFRVATRLRSLVGALAALSILTLGSGVASAAPAHASHHTWYVQAGTQSPNGAIMGMVYLPGTLTIDVGDSVVWVGNSAEPHTVTFNPQYPADNNPFAPATAGGAFNGARYVNSGAMTNLPQSVTGFPSAHSFSLTFTRAGTFHYICLFHPGMAGTVKVNPAGSAYPKTQRQINFASTIQSARIVASGYALMAREDARASNHLVFAGATDMNTGADVMRFMLPTVVIQAGQSVTFENPSMEPHTVTIGTEPASCPPEAGPSCDMGSTTYSGGYFNHWLNPGMAPDHSVTITFTKAGTYHYVCGLHDYMGMVGTVIVVP